MKPHLVLDLYSIYVLVLVLITVNLKFLKGYWKLIYPNNVFGTKIHRYSSKKTTRYNGILIQSQLRIQTKRKYKKILCKSPLVLILHGWNGHGKMVNMSSLLKEESLRISYSKTMAWLQYSLELGVEVVVASGKCMYISKFQMLCRQKLPLSKLSYFVSSWKRA